MSPTILKYPTTFPMWSLGNWFGLIISQRDFDIWEVPSFDLIRVIDLQSFTMSEQLAVSLIPFQWFAVSPRRKRTIYHEEPWPYLKQFSSNLKISKAKKGHILTFEKLQSSQQDHNLSPQRIRACTYEHTQMHTHSSELPTSEGFHYKFRNLSRLAGTHKYHNSFK